MKIRALFSIIISKTVLFLSKKFLKGGSNFPGRIALKLYPDILNIVAKNYKTIIVTGTNGKTTTTSMIFNIIKDSGIDVITNNTGANMLPGIVSSFIENFSFNISKTRYAIMEVDEANVKFITEHIEPSAIIITNLFRDQLDRYGEVYTTLNKILEGVKKVPKSKLILNGDEPLLGKLGLENPVVYYGFNTPIDLNKKVDVNADAKFCKFCKTPYEYEYVLYNHLGSYFCPNCDFKRPDLKYSVTEIKERTSEHSFVTINNKGFMIYQPGIYNIYNLLCAYAVAREFDISEDIIYNSILKQRSSFGRQETVKLKDKELRIILVKNPAGYNQAIETLSLNNNELSLCFILNDNYADGRDVSWIWDVNFEKLATLSINEILISGMRAYDMAVRLKISGLSEDKFNISSDMENLLNQLENSQSNNIYVLTTYTAMLSLRKALHSKGYIDKLW